MSSYNLYGMGYAQMKQEGMVIHYDELIGVGPRIWVDKDWYAQYLVEVALAQRCRLEEGKRDA